MTATMLAHRLSGWGEPPALVEVPVPRAGPGQVVVRVGGCGLCHSDLAMMAMPHQIGESLGWTVPFTLGHETAGWVAEVGAGVTGLEVDQPVAVASPSWCGRCRWCLRGQENACSHGLVGRGYGRDGGQAGFLLVDDPRALLPIGSLDPVTAAPLTDAGATSHHAVRRVLPRLPGDGVAIVIGAGGLGAFVIQILRARSSATVVALDPDPVRRRLASDLGAHHVVDGVGEGTGRALGELLGGDRADAVIDLVGTDATIATGIGALAPGGAFALVGAAGGTLRRPWYGTLPRDGEVLTFQGSDRVDAVEVLALAEAGSVRVDVDRRPLAAVAAAYDDLHRGGLTGRLVITP